MVYKREGTRNYYCRFSINGKEIKRSTGTANKKEAEEFEAKLKTESWRQSRLGEKPKRTWEDACLKWLEEQNKRSIEKDKEIIRWTLGHIGGFLLVAISREVLERVRNTKAEESSKNTPNRYMALIRAILNKARDEWEWIEDVPKVAMFKIEKPSFRWITEEQFERLCEALPPHLEHMARFAVLTGLRRANVTGLTWAKVNIEKKHCWVEHSDAKGKKAISVPLSDKAIELLLERKAAAEHRDFVFTYKGEPVYQTSTKAWRRALKECDLEELRWHDLRHTWASWHVQAGTPLEALKELGGWSSLDMVMRYAHLAPRHLAQWANNI